MPLLSSQAQRGLRELPYIGRFLEPISKSLLPIYYDGDSKIYNLKNLDIEDFTGTIENKFSTREISNADLDYAIKEIESIDKVKLLNNLKFFWNLY